MKGDEEMGTWDVTRKNQVMDESLKMNERKKKTKHFGAFNAIMKHSQSQPQSPVTFSGGHHFLYSTQILCILLSFLFCSDSTTFFFLFFSVNVYVTICDL